MITDNFYKTKNELALGELVQIQPGYLSRQRVRSDRNGSHYLLQARDVSPGDGIDLNGTVRFTPERQADLYQVSRDDVLLLARGQAHWVYFVQEELEDVLAANVFYILRAKRDRIRPAYLAWILNVPDNQTKINALSRGTSIGYISKQTLATFTIPTPPLDIQVRIERIILLHQKQRRLQAQLDEKREQLIHAVCRAAIMKPEE